MGYFRLVVRESFEAAHKLDYHEGRCRFLHGHGYRVEVKFKAHKLNHIGVTVDFDDLKKYVKHAVDQLDHCYLNEHQAFQERQTSAENIALYLYEQISQKCYQEEVKVEGVIVWEEQDYAAEYVPEE